MEREGVPTKIPERSGRYKAGSASAIAERKIKAGESKNPPRRAGYRKDLLVLWRGRFHDDEFQHLFVKVPDIHFCLDRNRQ